MEGWMDGRRNRNTHTHVRTHARGHKSKSEAGSARIEDRCCAGTDRLHCTALHLLCNLRKPHALRQKSIIEIDIDIDIETYSA